MAAWKGFIGVAIVVLVVMAIANRVPAIKNIVGG
jgi:hypothetical protein